MMIEGMDYVVRPVGWLTGDIHAMVRCDEDGVYNIYVNENLSPEARDEAVSHELAHIERIKNVLIHMQNDIQSKSVSPKVAENTNDSKLRSNGTHADDPCKRQGFKRCQ